MGVHHTVHGSSTIVDGCSRQLSRHHQHAAIRSLYPAADCEAIEAIVHKAVATAGPGTRLALPPRGYLARYGYVIATGADAAQIATDLAEPEQLVELHAKPLID